MNNLHDKITKTKLDIYEAYESDLITLEEKRELLDKIDAFICETSLSDEKKELKKKYIKEQNKKRNYHKEFIMSDYDPGNRFKEYDKLTDQLMNDKDYARNARKILTDPLKTHAEALDKNIKNLGPIKGTSNYITGKNITKDAHKEQLTRETSDKYRRSDYSKEQNEKLDKRRNEFDRKIKLIEQRYLNGKPISKSFKPKKKK